MSCRRKSYSASNEASVVYFVIVMRFFFFHLVVSIRCPCAFFPPPAQELERAIADQATADSAMQSAAVQAAEDRSSAISAEVAKMQVRPLP